MIRTVHRAARPQGAVQRCSHCGVVLREAVADPVLERHFAVGARVEILEDDGVITRSVTADPVTCDGLQRYRQARSLRARGRRRRS